jgi:hypothetical protein
MLGRMISNVNPTVGQVTLRGLGGIKWGAHNLMVLVLHSGSISVPHGYCEHWEGCYVQEDIEADEVIGEDNWALVKGDVVVAITAQSREGLHAR